MSDIIDELFPEDLQEPAPVPASVPIDSLVPGSQNSSIHSVPEAEPVFEESDDSFAELEAIKKLIASEPGEYSAKEPMHSDRPSDADDTVEQPKANRIRHRVFPTGLLVLPLVLLALECIVRATAEISFMNSSFGGTVFACLAYGALFGFFCMLPRNVKVSRLLCGIFAELFTVWFTLAYFTYNSYDVFMGIGIMISETGNVIGTFSDAIISVFKNGIWMILLYQLPFVLYIVFRKKTFFYCKPKWAALAALPVLVFCFGFIGFKLDTKNEDKAAVYTNQYNYDNAVHDFGVLTSLQLDARYLVFGNPAEDDISFLDEDDGFVMLNGNPSDEFDPEGEPASKEDEDMPVPGSTPAEVTPSEPAPTEETPAVVEYGYNVLDIDFDKLIAESTNKKLTAIHQYVSSLTPSKQNEYTGLFEGKNLILVCAESFCKEVIDPERTPTLYRMATKGIVLEEFYQPTWGGSTSTGEYSFVTGIIPSSSSAMQNSIGHNMYFTLGNQLQRQGYFSACYHNATSTYYKRNKTHTNLGYSTFTTCDDGFKGKMTVQWPYSDLEMMELSIEDYIDRQPFSIYYMTVSGHPDFAYSANAMARKNWSIVENMNYPKKVLGYLGCQQELESALTYLIAQLEEAGIADDTVIAVCPDHYPYGLQKSSSWNNSTDWLNYLYGSHGTNIARDHNIAMIWCRSLEDREEPIVVSAPTYSLDLVPTLSNLFGLPYDSRLLVGRDILSDTEPLVIWGDMSWKSDKGYYNHSKGTFTPNDGVTVDSDYVSGINAKVSNAFTYSRAYTTYDYFRVLFGEDEYK